MTRKDPEKRSVHSGEITLSSIVCDIFFKRIQKNIKMSCLFTSFPNLLTLCSLEEEDDFFSFIIFSAFF